MESHTGDGKSRIDFSAENPGLGEVTINTARAPSMLRRSSGSYRLDGLITAPTFENQISLTFPEFQGTQGNKKAVLDVLLENNSADLSEETARAIRPSLLKRHSRSYYLNSLTTATELEKGISLTDHSQQDLPEKRRSKWIRNLRFKVLTMYRRIFGIVFTINMAILIATVIHGLRNPQNVTALHLSSMVIGNLFVAILMRQDEVVNAWFKIFCMVPSSWPMWIRRICARVYAIGGIHSGCGISALGWLLLFTVQATREVIFRGKTSIATLVITYLNLSLLLIIVAFAHPKVRVKFHNNFEQTHRFLGWTSLALLWGQVISLTNDYKPSDEPFSVALTRARQPWLVFIMTLSVMSSWLYLRKVPVQAEVLSSHAIRLYFSDELHPTPGSFRRISDCPLKEWHSFATIAEPGKTGYSIVISKAGDWTSRQIQNPPKEIWVRGRPTLGVLRVITMFRKIVLVATGSGIGPCAPHIYRQSIPMKVLWTAPDVRGTFGNKLVDSILAAAPDAVIHDTRTHGKPDMVKLTYNLVQETGAEAVIIISNQRLTDKVVYGMMSRGIPAFGAIWDS